MPALRTYRPVTFDPKEYGCKADGTTDDSVAFQACLTAAANAGGGHILLPEGIIRCDSQITIPSSSGKMTGPIKISGQGCHSVNDSAAPSKGSVLDLRYSGSNAKIVALGVGALTLEWLTLTDLGTSSTPFVLVIGATLFARDMAVVGNNSKSTTSCDQDAFVLGGTTTSTAFTSVTDAFGGYGTVIERVQFDRIRRGVYGKVYCNAVVVRDNYFGIRCGSNAASTAPAIELNHNGVGFCRGNLVTGNIIEMVGYGYGILCGGAVNAFVSNGFWDAGGAYLADHLFISGAVDNHVVGDLQNGSTPYVDNNGGNYIQAFGSGTQTMYGQYVVQAVGAGSTPLTVKARTAGQASDIVTVKNSAGTTTWSFNSNGALSCTTGLGTTIPLSIVNNTAGNAAAEIRNAFRSGVKIADGGSPTGTIFDFLNGSGTAQARLVVGSGTPEAAVVAPVGSVFLRTNGGAGTSFYVKESGTGNTGWVAK